VSRRQWLIATGVAMIAFWIAMGVIERSLPEGTPGVIEYEFVGSEDRAAEMLAEWGDPGQDDIRLSLWIDYGFMLVYGAFFTLAGLATRDFAREHGKRALASVGRWAPWCAVGAAIFDALENANLLLILGGHGGSIAPPLATTCASIKFVLIVTAIGYVVWGLVARFRARSG
jgi:hypothetical protein